MTSILDQFEQASQVNHRSKSVAEAMTSSGYITMKHDDNIPIFSKHKMKFNPSDAITHFAVASDLFVIAMADGKLFRMDMENPNKSEEIDYTKFVQDRKLTGLFLDPLGHHLLLAFSPKTRDGNPNLFYLNRMSSKLKAVTKSRNCEISEIGWNYENKSAVTTDLILLGTSQGFLLETEIECDSDKMFTANHQYWRQIFDIGQTITGILFHRVNNSKRYFIFITTPNRLYQFVGNAVYTDGKLSLQMIFHPYLTMPATGFQEIPSKLSYSKLQFFYNSNNVPKTLAWLTEPGVFYGQIDPNSQEMSLFTQSKLIPFPSTENKESADNVPLSFVLSDFHALFMYADRIKIVSFINHDITQEDVFLESSGKLKTIVKDPVKKFIYVVTDKNVYRYRIVREDRNVWRIYCDNGQFHLAKEFCQNNPAFINIVNVKEAEQLFTKGDYERSAELFAETRNNFETVCFKFLEIDNIKALTIYLCMRLEALDDDDKTLISMIVIWSTELYLSQLAQLRHTGHENSVKYQQIQTDFEMFLRLPKVKKCMQHVRSVIYELMSSHGDKQNLINLAKLNEDYESVIAQYMYKKCYIEVLGILQTLKRPELFYQFATELLEEVPKPTVNALISQGQKLWPLKLLPAFLACEKDEKHVSEIIRYLEFMLQNFNVKDMAIHNYLLTLYVEHDEVACIRYLERQGDDPELVKYDVHYALRLCREKNLSRACVKLSCLLGLWEAAVELALTTDASLAKQVADRPDNPDLRKQLWLTIAEHMITKSQDLSVAMTFLKECPLIKIEDILPFFSDVVTIDHFREPICQSLQEYNNQIEQEKMEINEATECAEKVRSEIQSFRNRSVVVSVSEECSLCELALLLRPFYLFPCGHKFHSDCLLTETLPTLSSARRNKLSDVQRQLKILSNIELSALTATGLPRREVLKNEIDDIIASECVFCGEQMINCIDKPFIADDEWDAVMREWE